MSRNKKLEFRKEVRVAALANRVDFTAAWYQPYGMLRDLSENEFKWEHVNERKSD